MLNNISFVVSLLCSLGASIQSDQVSAKPKLLYLTQAGDPWHDYKWQAETLQQTLPQWVPIEITALGVRDKKETLQALKEPGFAAGYDILVYNACFAYSTDYLAIDHIRRQARELGIPVILLHCAMHNFRSTSPSLGPLGHILSAFSKSRWKDWDMLPQWSLFTGMDSLLHHPIGPLTLTKAGTHPITDGLPDQVRLERDELYIALSETPDSMPLYYGQTAKGDIQPVVWVRREGKAEVVGITLGHDEDTWTHEFFWQILAQSVRYLTRAESHAVP